MKRMLLPLLAASLLTLLAPAVASAHRGHHHHHARSHHHHATSARLVNFGAGTLAASGTATSPVQATPTNESAGTVESFEAGVLKIKLGDGTIVSGKVTEETELRCQPATPPTEPGDDDGGDDENAQQGDQQHGSPGSDQFAAQHGDVLAHSADTQGGDDQGEGDGGEETQESCTTAVLVHGAIVREAELKLTGSGAVWEKLDIVH
jgi:hypothetical protein